MVAPDFLREVLNYDASSGDLTWKARPVSHFKDARAQKSWNTRCAGKRTGWVDRDGYLRVNIGGTPHLAHRLVWAIVHGEYPIAIDHRDGDPGNNRLENLRACSNSENQHNRGITKASSTGYKGVSFHKQRGRWRATIFVHSKQRHLGLFDSPEAAYEAYCRAADELHGAFANHGVPALAAV